MDHSQRVASISKHPSTKCLEESASGVGSKP